MTAILGLLPDQGAPVSTVVHGAPVTIKATRGEKFSGVEIAVYRAWVNRANWLLFAGWLLVKIFGLKPHIIDMVYHTEESRWSVGVRDNSGETLVYTEDESIAVTTAREYTTNMHVFGRTPLAAGPAISRY